jgi:hypothetical protein
LGLRLGEFRDRDTRIVGGIVAHQLEKSSSLFLVDYDFIVSKLEVRINANANDFISQMIVNQLKYAVRGDDASELLLIENLLIILRDVSTVIIGQEAFDSGSDL